MNGEPWWQRACRSYGLRPSLVTSFLRSDACDAESPQDEYYKKQLEKQKRDDCPQAAELSRLKKQLAKQEALPRLCLAASKATGAAMVAKATGSSMSEAWSAFPAGKGLPPDEFVSCLNYSMGILDTVLNRDAAYFELFVIQAVEMFKGGGVLSISELVSLRLNFQAVLSQNGSWKPKADVAAPYGRGGNRNGSGYNPGGQGAKKANGPKAGPETRVCNAHSSPEGCKWHLKGRGPCKFLPVGHSPALLTNA